MKMQCDGCRTPKHERVCPCVEKTVKDIVRIGQRRQRVKDIEIDLYFTKSVGRSRKMRGEAR